LIPAGEGPGRFDQQAANEEAHAAGTQVAGMTQFLIQCRKNVGEKRVSPKKGSARDIWCLT
jgi:hypothetical protein